MRTGGVRAASTLVGAGIASLLVWVATQIGTGYTGGYWAANGLLAAGGLVLALSQVAGGWTKWGMPRLSLPVLVAAFVPVLVCAGWVLLAGQPDANWFQRHVVAWSGHAGIRGLVDDLRGYLAVLAFGTGVVLGFTFDTTGPRPAREVPLAIPASPPQPEAHAPEPAEEPEPAPVVPVP